MESHFTMTVLIWFIPFICSWIISEINHMLKGLITITTLIFSYIWYTFHLIGNLTNFICAIYFTGKYKLIYYSFLYQYHFPYICPSIYFSFHFPCHNYIDIYGFFFVTVWIHIWWVRRFSPLNTLPQSLHQHGFSPVCISISNDFTSIFTDH